MAACLDSDNLFTGAYPAIIGMPTRGLEPRTRRLVDGCSIPLSYVGYCFLLR